VNVTSRSKRPDVVKVAGKVVSLLVCLCGGALLCPVVGVCAALLARRGVCSKAKHRIEAPQVVFGVCAACARGVACAFPSLTVGF